MVLHKIKTLNEEIARWAFEIRVNSRKTSWRIAFTNPTAGPWKTIKYYDTEGKLGEVYRYQLTEERPDIILVNEELKIVLIVEAKDSMRKLSESGQVEKSVKVMSDLTKILKGLGKNPYWGVRSEYVAITGLLWGTITLSTEEERSALFETYRKKLVQNPHVDNSYIVGIESYYDGESIICNLFTNEKVGLSHSQKNLIDESLVALND